MSISSIPRVTAFAASAQHGRSDLPSLFCRALKTGARTLYSLLCTGLLLLYAAAGTAQQLDSKGTEFVLMFTANYNSESATLFITGDIATTGLVSIPGLGFSSPFAVTPGDVSTVSLPANTAEEGVDVVGAKGIFVTAQDEVTVYGLSQSPASTDAYLGLPVDILGTEYIAQGYENVNIVNGSQFGVVAAQDNTTVTITPTETVGARTAGVPYDISMNRGDTYQLRTTASAPADLSGSLISADLPIAVFGGHHCANIPAGFTFCDHIEEQLPPVSTWGQSFATLPLATRLNGDTFRILAAENGTSVSINGAPAATLNRGEFLETILTTAATVNADKPVLLTQYSNSTSFDSVTSDPFQVVVPPFEQFLASYTVTTPAIVFDINFIGVVAPDAAVGAITLDGVPIPAGDFSPIGTSGFSGAQLSVSVGNHSLNGPLPFGITVYGFAQADSYGYPGGLALGEIAELDQLLLTPPTATSPVNTEQCVTATALDQNSNPLAGIRVDFTASGANTADSFIFSDGQGEAEFCYTGTSAGDDSIVATVGSLTAQAQITWQGGGSGGVAACDVDDNGVISRMDVRIIAVFRGGQVTAGTSGDFDSDGVLTRRDVKACLQELGTVLNPPV